MSISMPSKSIFSLDLNKPSNNAVGRVVVNGKNAQRVLHEDKEFSYYNKMYFDLSEGFVEELSVIDEIQIYANLSWYEVQPPIPQYNSNGGMVIFSTENTTANYSKENFGMVPLPKYFKSPAIRQADLYSGTTRYLYSINLPMSDNQSQYKLETRLEIDQNNKLHGRIYNTFTVKVPFHVFYKIESFTITATIDGVEIDMGDIVVYDNESQEKSKKEFSVPNNEFLQSEAPTEVVHEKLPEIVAKDISTNWKNGKETATILCSISDYYDQSGAVVSPKSNKMVFEIGDEVIPMTRKPSGKDEPMSLYTDGTPKVFNVVGRKMIYDGAVWQELTLQEKTMDEGKSTYYEYAANDQGGWTYTITSNQFTVTENVSGGKTYTIGAT